MLRNVLHLSVSQLKNGLATVCSLAKSSPLKTFSRLHCYSEDRNKMIIKAIPAFTDNFMYLIIDQYSRETAVVDPADAEAILCIVKENDYNLTKVLTTHHHWDHAGGNTILKKELPELLIYGGDNRVEGVTSVVCHGDKFKLGDMVIQCLSTPCHTSGHVCYYVTKNDMDGAVFTGDTLFVAGCGKFFEGTADQMYNNLINILSMLPDETKVYCGHEYTITNLKFASQVEPYNEYVQSKLNWACHQISQHLHTVPSTIGEEKLTNPFMRVCEQTVLDYTVQLDPVSAMARLRAEKDRFNA